MPDFGIDVTFPDERKIYPWWCVVLGHYWRRIPYTYPRQWIRRRTCKRCINIPQPPSREEWQ